MTEEDIIKWAFERLGTKASSAPESMMADYHGAATTMSLKLAESYGRRIIGGEMEVVEGLTYCFLLGWIMRGMVENEEITL